MNRKEFLSSLGFSAAALALTSCLGGCEKDENNNTPAPTVDFTFDKTDPQYAALLNLGGYIYLNGVIIAQTTAGNIIAVSQSFTHQGTAVQYQGGNDRFLCPNHQATFDNSGSVTSGPASSSLKQYTVTTNGNLIHVNG